MKILKATLAGTIGTAAMSLATIISVPSLNIPPQDPIGLLQHIFFGSAALGWISHFAIGIILAYFYAAYEKHFPGSPAVRGMLFSLIPWFVFQIFILPLLGYAMLGGSLTAALLSIFRHSVYGSILGAMYGENKIKKKKA